MNSTISLPSRIIASALMLLAASASAQSIPVTGNASIAIEGGVFSSSPSKDDMQRAIDAARLSLWKNYAARSFSEARTKQMLGREAEIQARLGDFLSDVTVVDKSHDKATNTFRVAVRGNVNATLVDQFFHGLVGGAAVGGGSGDANATGNAFAFLMMARQVTLVRQFDAKVIKVEEHSASHGRRDAESESSGARGQVGSIESTETALSKRTTGGSVERKSDQVSYQVQSSQDIDTAIGSTITSGGFEMITYDDVASNCQGADPTRVRAEFVAADEMSMAMRKQVIDAVRRCEVRYFGVGTIDSGASDIDPVSGQRRVVVSVRAQVLDVSKRLPTRVASVGPVQFAALGDDQAVATRRALERAARESTRTLIDQLNSKGIR